MYRLCLIRNRNRNWSHVGSNPTFTTNKLKNMKWEIQYRKKGDNGIKNEVVDVHFENKNDVKRWWIGKSKVFVDSIGSKTIGTYRDDKEFINCKKYGS